MILEKERANAINVSGMPVGPSREESLSCGRRWGVILAGGDGIRLRAMTRLIAGDDRPKQFCPIIGSETMLQQTIRRAERNIPADQFVVSLTKSHREFYKDQPGVSPSHRIVQPANKGTVAPIVHGLLSIERMEPNALVAILPCDHYYANESAGANAMEEAFEIAAQRPDLVVLLAANPSGPDVEYGWIEPGAPTGYGHSLYAHAFHEKPSVDVARDLFRRGGLWSTFEMVGHVCAFLDMIRDTLPDVVECIPQSSLWTGSELQIPDAVYDRIPTLSFSRDVLSQEPGRLAILLLRHAGWSDIGCPERVNAVLNSMYR